MPAGGRHNRPVSLPPSILGLSLRQLQAFAILAETRHFTRAAGLCHLSQPAFSAQIRALEDSLGTRLFDRDTRSVTLTPEGEHFLAAARALLADAGSAWQDLQERVLRERGRATLALLPALAAGWLPPVLAAFNARHPGIQVAVADVLSEHCVEQVRSGRADLALAASPPADAELLVEPFCSDDFRLVCRRDHPLAAQAEPLPLQALAGQPFIHLARHSSVRQHLEQALYPQVPPPPLELEQLASVAGMVRAGLGITVVPRLTLAQFAHPELCDRALDAPGLRRQIHVVRHRRRSLSAAARALLEHLEAHRPADAEGSDAAPLRDNPQH